MLTAITQRTAVSAALRAFYRRLKHGERTRRNLGHQGTTTERHAVYWHKSAPLWAVLETSEGGEASWNCFGTKLTDTGTNLTISCEINVPHAGMNRRMGGVFASDAAGKPYIAHTGKIGRWPQGYRQDQLRRIVPRDRAVSEDVYWPGVRKPMRCHPHQRAATPRSSSAFTPS